MNCWRSLNSPLTLVLNSATGQTQTFVLVLDDYHLISAPPVHQALTFLLDRMPANMHLVLATREDPSLPLARLRARGQLVELRASDLRMTPEQAESAFSFSNPRSLLLLLRKELGYGLSSS